MTPSSSNAPDAALVERLVLSSHGNLEAVREMVAAHPELIDVPHEWPNGDLETPLGAASHVGNRPIAEFLLQQGAPMDICAAAMLGRDAVVDDLLDADPATAATRGAHGISLLYHVALGGDVRIASRIAECTQPAAEDFNRALVAAVQADHPEMVRWLLDEGVTDPSVPDHRGRTPLDIAVALEREEIEGLLREAGAEHAPGGDKPADTR